MKNTLSNLMERLRSFFTFSMVVFCFLLFHNEMPAQKDSLLKIKSHKHYFAPSFFLDYYQTGKSQTERKRVNAKGLGNYQYFQVNGSYLIPMITHDFVKDSATIANFHLLTTGNFLFAMPRFDSISNHTIGKFGLGVRAIYNTGRKGIWFFDFSPFFAQDLSYKNATIFRYANTIIYDHVFSDKFSLRFGYAKTFLWGNRFHLPYVGMRIGKLDGVNFSVQFPRSASFNFPIGRIMKGSLFIKPVGGVYNFSNHDTLYFGTDKTIQFQRIELMNGFRWEAHPSRNFGFFLSTGMLMSRKVQFSSLTYNKRNNGLLAPFYSEKIAPTWYFNVGLTMRFGKTKKVYNNKNIYEMFDLNNSIDSGDNNALPASSDIPGIPRKKKNKASIADVKDLIEVEDLYQ